MDSAKAPHQILLVDDSAAFLAALREYVAGFPQLRVAATAVTGEQAVALAELLSPDLVLMDLEMPGIGGLEATRIIKALPRRPQIVMVTLHDVARLRRAALEAGADFHIVKGRLHDEFPAVVARMAQS